MFSFIYGQWGQLFCSLSCIEQYMLTGVITVNFIGFIVFYLDYHVPAKLSIPLYDSALNGQPFCCATFFLISCFAQDNHGMYCYSISFNLVFVLRCCSYLIKSR